MNNLRPTIAAAAFIACVFALGACRPGPSEIEIGRALDHACSVTSATSAGPGPRQCNASYIEYSCARGYSELVASGARQRLALSDINALRERLRLQSPQDPSPSLSELTREVSIEGEARILEHYQSAGWTPPCPASCPQTPWPVNDRETEVCIEGVPQRAMVSGGVGSWGEPAACYPREIVARIYADCARHWLLRGDAELAQQDVQCLADSAFNREAGTASLCPGGYRGGQAVIGVHVADTALESAIESWRRSTDWGRLFGAQAAIVSQQRLQAHTVQCISSAQSLERLSRTTPGSAGDTIRLSIRQRALNALGHYPAGIDGRYGPSTSRAVRSFQRELGYDETGVLSPRQTVLLMCHAAQTARDSKIQNTLGIMYALGLGVEQNTDLALEWLEMSSRRSDADAYFNLAIIYGTGAVLGSYRLCGIVENTDLADAHLSEAARLGHPVARQWRSSSEFQRVTDSAQRWALVRRRLSDAAVESQDMLAAMWQREHIDLTNINQISLPCLSAEAFRGQLP